MNICIIEKLKILLEKYTSIQNCLLDEKIIFDEKKYNTLLKKCSYVDSIVNIFVSWLKSKKNIETTKTLLSDPEIKDMALEEIKVEELNLRKYENKIQSILLCNDEDDKRNCFLEIRAGTGGNESTIFANDLFRMYMRYFESKKWIINIEHMSHSELGGYKEIIIKVSGKNAYGNLKFESGGHRVQRVPCTESQGRIHTSTCTVAVLPDISLPESKIDIKDLKIDTFRSSGAGGQHVNTTDSAVRITHIPSGIVVECQNERSQHKNKSTALSILSARMRALEIKQHNKIESKKRKNLLGSGSRTDRIRTYNFSQSRVTDHRINLTVYKLENILNGKLDYLISPIIEKYQINQLSDLLEKIK